MGFVCWPVSDRQGTIGVSHLPSPPLPPLELPLVVPSGKSEVCIVISGCDIVGQIARVWKAPIRIMTDIVRLSCPNRRIYRGGPLSE